MINAINASNYDQFICISQLDVEEPEIFSQVMQDRDTI